MIMIIMSGLIIISGVVAQRFAWPTGRAASLITIDRGKRMQSRLACSLATQV